MKIKLTNDAVPLRLAWSEATRTGVVLAMWRYEFVVWDVCGPTQEALHCTGGDYGDSLAWALPKFNRRAARFFGIETEGTAP